MPSVIASSRSSIASIMDMFGETANAGVQLIRTGAKTISMLDAKADVMHTRVMTNCAIQKLSLTEEELMNAAVAHADRLEDFHRKTSPNTQFDREAATKAAYQRFESALKL